MTPIANEKFDVLFVENKLKKKHNKCVVVKGVRQWIIKKINCGGYLSVSLIDDWVVVVGLGN